MTDPSSVRRPLVWLQLIIGWLPVWALYTLLVVTAHRGSHGWWAALAGARAIAVAALLGIAVDRLTKRWAWPRPVSPTFVLRHGVAAAGFAATWIGLLSAVESVLRWQLVVVATPNGVTPFFILGIWLYVMVASVSYATQATARAARAEAAAVEAELGALRSQLNPHFLFNTLHTVVQLIPADPALAAKAAEQLAALLRVTLERDRDLVRLADELAFVERYLAIEQIRFGDRLAVRFEVPDGVRDLEIPSFAVQTLIENAVRHGAAPKVAPTTIWLRARREGVHLVIEVADDGAGAGVNLPRVAGVDSAGTGLKRLADRLQARYRSGASLVAGPSAEGYRATIRVPVADD